MDENEDMIDTNVPSGIIDEACLYDANNKNALHKNGQGQ